MKFDDIIEELGEFGPYQKKIYYLVCLAGIPSALQTLVIVFTMGHQDHRCAIPGLTNDSYSSHGSWHDDIVKHWVPWDSDEDAYSNCQLYKSDPTTNTRLNSTEDCSSYVYDFDTFDATVFSDFGMVCDDKALKTYANMVFMVGLLAGSLILGPLSDMIGRRKVMCIGATGNAAINIGIVFATSYTSFVILRFFTAFFSVGTFLAAFVIGMEIVGPGKRKFAGIIIELFWCLGLFLLGLFAYVIRDWKYLQLACAIPTCLLAVIYILMMPESPRWLINKQRFDDASKVLGKVARGNGVTLSEKAQDLTNLDNEAANEKIWQMFTNKTLLIRSLIIFFNWLVASLVYYGLSLNVGSLSGDIYLNFTLSAVVEGVSYIFCIILLDRAGRRPLQCFTMLVAGVACLGTIFPVIFGGDDVKWVTVVLSLIGKFGASAAFAIIYIYSAELFPTALRNSGMGASSFAARIGGIVAPYIADLGDYVDADLGVALPLVIFGGMSLLAGLAAILLPETTNKILPDSVEDAITFGSKKTKKNAYALEDVASGMDKQKNGKDNPSFHL